MRRSPAPAFPEYSSAYSRNLSFLSPILAPLAIRGTLAGMVDPNPTADGSTKPLQKSRRKLVLCGIGIAAVSFLFWKLLTLEPMGDYFATLDRMRGYVATHESAITRLPIAVQFEELFPGKTDHFITHYGFSGEATNLWNSEAYFNGRYSLTMQIPVTVDYRHNTITPAGDPVYYLEEITQYDGGLARYGGLHARFGNDEWENLYNSHGDFAVIGLAVKSDAPIPNFEKLVDAVRAPLIPISLLNKSSDATNE
jgi:hypothetical protein